MPLFPHRMRLLAAAAILGLLTAAPVRAAAQGGPTARTPYTVAAGKSVVDSMAATLRARYADADTGAMIAAHIQQRFAGGAYARVGDWGQFTAQLTLDLQAVNQDTHLFVSADAGGGPGGPGGRPDHGLMEVRRLDGNVGYFRMANFSAAPAAFDAVVGALRVLAVSDAVIIDLRNSRGGSPALVNFIISHFTTADTTLSLIVYDRVRDVTTPRYTLREVPGPRRPDVPLYVLTDDVTRSAAEDLPFVLQNMKRATIVGGRTAGAGRNNMGVSLGHGISGSVSFTRVMEPGTRREWEHKGVMPDVVLDPDSALAWAHRDAVTKALARAQGPARAELERTLRGIEAQQAAESRAARSLRPAAGLERYVGTYEGGQTIAIVGDRLVFQPRIAQPREVLAPVGDGELASGAVRYRFAAGATGVTLTVVGADGATSRFARTSAAAPRRDPR